MSGQIIRQSGVASLHESKFDFTFTVVCLRTGKNVFRVIYEHGSMSDARDGKLLKRLAPDTAKWAKFVLRERDLCKSTPMNPCLKGLNDAVNF